MSLEPFSPSNHHHHHHHVIVTRKSRLASRPRRPTWFCRTTRSRGSALLDFSTGEHGSSSSSWEGGTANWGKIPTFSENRKWWAPLIDYYLYRLPNLCHFDCYRYCHYHLWTFLQTTQPGHIGHEPEQDCGDWTRSFWGSLQHWWDVSICICLCTWIWGNA